jgi:hypothetical protein
MLQPTLRVSGMFLGREGGVSGSEVGTLTITSAADYNKLPVGSVMGILIVDGIKEILPTKVITVVSTSSFIPCKIYILSTGGSQYVTGTIHFLLN